MPTKPKRRTRRPTPVPKPSGAREATSSSPAVVPGSCHRAGDEGIPVTTGLHRRDRAGASAGVGLTLPRDLAPSSQLRTASAPTLEGLEGLEARKWTYPHQDLEGQAGRSGGRSRSARGEPCIRGWNLEWNSLGGGRQTG
ncbi:hypothetical protein B2J93_3233 [Marssonina coronariae]|uniref:Uncharacterized protein n=1 Tax=Diplocarpon coronariae TaxID=2795749 RepID=A0A218Z5B4_9HELO|nr:hypothetical protein B2J93_3233 [Marssonina coronariae]